MPIINLGLLTELSDPPTQADPANFAERADTFLTELLTFADEMNAAISEMNKMTTGLDQATPIAAWEDSPTSYDFPDVVAGSDGYNYRCMGTDVVGVDPTDGTADWFRLPGLPNHVAGDAGKHVAVAASGGYQLTPALDTLTAIGNAGTAPTLDTTTADTFTMTCDQATMDISGLVLDIGRTITLIFTGANTCTITWPSGTQWPNGVIPDFSAGVDRVVLQRVSASAIHASKSGGGYA